MLHVLKDCLYASKRGSVPPGCLQDAGWLCLAASPAGPAILSRCRCFTCGKVIGNKWETYLDLLQAEYSEG